MKKNFTESLDSRLLKYSVASAAVLSLTGVAIAQVSGVSDNINLTGNGNSYQITFNNIPKFTIKIQSPGSGGLLLSSSKASFIPESANKYVKALNSNSIVSGGKQFSHNASTKNFFILSSSNFPGKGDKYIGVRFKLTDGIHYGWIKVNVSSNGQSVTIISHAYNTTAGNSITANGVLPVELTTFTANNLGDKVELNWNTATEVNNYGFEIQRSAVSSQKSDVGSKSSIANNQ